jgi:hypothetical protein
VNKEPNDDLFAGFDPEEHELLTMAGYDDCIVGIVERFGQDPIVCYDTDKVICHLQNDGMDIDDAQDYLCYNLLGSWMGDATPCFLSTNTKQNGEIK